MPLCSPFITWRQIAAHKRIESTTTARCRAAAGLVTQCHQAVSSWFIEADVVHCILDGFPSLSHVTTSVRNVGRFYPGHAWINFVKKWRWGGEKKEKQQMSFLAPPS